MTSDREGAPPTRLHGIRTFAANPVSVSESSFTVPETIAADPPDASMCHELFSSTEISNIPDGATTALYTLPFREKTMTGASEFSTEYDVSLSVKSHADKMKDSSVYEKS